jgi:hypothetical protein
MKVPDLIGPTRSRCLRNGKAGTHQRETMPLGEAQQGLAAHEYEIAERSFAKLRIERSKKRRFTRILFANESNNRT